MTSLNIEVQSIVEDTEIDHEYQYNQEHVETVKTLDLATAQEFITALTGSAHSKMNFRTVLEQKDKSSKVENFKGTAADSQGRIEQLNNQGAAIYFTVQHSDVTPLENQGIKAKDIETVRALFIDFDGFLPAQDEWHLQPSIISRNANNKGHAYWVLSEPVAMTAVEAASALKRLVGHYNFKNPGYIADLKCTDIARILRLPGSWHLKGKPTQVTIDYLGSERYSVDAVMVGITEDAGTRWEAVVAAKVAAEKVAAAKAKGAKGTVTRNSKPSNTLSLPSQKDNGDFGRMLAAVCTELSQMPAESGRNNYLNEKAFTLAGMEAKLFGGEKVGLLRADLTQAAIACGLDLAQIEATLNSAMAAGKEKQIAPYGSSGSGKPNILTLDTDIANSGLTVRLNQMTGKVEVDGQPIDLDMLRRFTTHKFGYTLSTEDAIQCWVGAGYENPYHPVVEYLRGIPDNTQTLDLSTLALELFGDPSPLAAVMVKRKLIAAVARVMQPGCKDDHLLVLMGAQGYRKTSFIEALFSAKWFTNDLTDISSKDDIQLLKEKWGIEMGEVDGVMTKKEDSELKAFLSKKEDIYRQAYKRENVSAKRSSSLWASTNKTDILQDPTGSRRYWVVQVNQKIDITQVEEMRDSIWFSALQAYVAGEIWYLTDAEEAEQKEVNKQFADIDPWFDTIKALDIAGKQGSGWATSYKLVYDHLNIPITAQSKVTQRRIAAVMTQLGYEFKYVKVEGKSTKVWWIAEKP